MMRRGRIFPANCFLSAAGCSRGATLLDVVVGSALMIIVFTGIVGAFQLSVDAVLNNKSRAGAIALANERLEYIRSLAYDAVGTVGGIPSGTIPQTESVTLNGVTYTRRTFVSYEDDPGDGLATADSNGIRTDYKSAKVTVSWSSRQGTRTLLMVARLSPPTGMESSIPGGTLSFQVANAVAQPVSNATIRIYNPSLSPTVDLTTFTDSAGTASVLGAPAGAGYQITVTKEGYSRAQTYSASSTNTNPSPAHLGVALNQTTAASFAIDVLGNLNIATFFAIQSSTTTEPFSNQSGIASSTNIAVSGGVARLSGAAPYPATGMLISSSVSTSSLASWGTFSWSATKPSGTNILFRFYNPVDMSLIPDSQISGNAAGLTTSPVSLANVSTSTYPALAVHATLTTSNTSNTPSIDSWSLTNDSGPLPFPNVSLLVRGAKTIGSGSSGPVYKFDQTLSSGSAASIALSNMEYDSYTLTPSSASYTVSSSCPPQPVAVTPASTTDARIYFSAATMHSLRVDVKNSSGATIPNASVRVYRTSNPSFNKTITTDVCGHAFFSGMNSGSGSSAYSIQVSASGYTTYTASGLNVSGATVRSVVLN